VHGGLFITTLMTYPCRLYYTGDISSDPKIKLGSLLAPSCRRTQSKGETIELLLATLFPNSLVTEEVMAPAAARSAKCFDCQVAPRVATYTGVEWPIDSFAPYKRQNMDGIFLALLQERRRIVVPSLVRIFRACLATDCVSAIWRQVRAVFILKSGKNCGFHKI